MTDEESGDDEREIGLQVDKEVNRDKTGEAGGMNLEVYSKDKVMHI